MIPVANYKRSTSKSWGVKTVRETLIESAKISSYGVLNGPLLDGLNKLNVGELCELLGVLRAVNEEVKNVELREVYGTDAVTAVETMAHTMLKR